MSLLKRFPSKPSVVAFSDNGDYLAVGEKSLQNNAEAEPVLRFLHTAEGLATDERLRVEGFYRSPAASLAWRGRSPAMGAPVGAL
jgi:hypothetical protein